MKEVIIGSVVGGIISGLMPVILLNYQDILKIVISISREFIYPIGMPIVIAATGSYIGNILSNRKGDKNE